MKIKKKLLSLTALALALFIGFSVIPYSEIKVKAIDTSEKAEQALRDEIDTLKDEQKDIKNKLEAAKKNEESQIKQKEYLDTLIFKTMTEIDKTNVLIEEYTTQIEEKATQITELEGEYARKLEELKARLHFSYVEGEMGYLELLLNSDNFIDFLVTAERVGYLLEYDRSLVNDVMDTLTTLNSEKVLLETAKKEQEDLKVELKATEEDLEAQIKETETYMAKYAAEQEILEEDYEELKRLEKEANAEIEKILAARVPEVPANNGNENIAPSPSAGSGQFIFPVGPGFRAVTSEYGPRTLWGRYDYHLGIDLAGSMGAPIYASAGGTVIKAEWHYSYGYYVLIDHGNGFATLYAHNSQLLVSVGQTVSQGDAIAKLGSTGSSSGPHLHFEVRYNGKTTNPRPYIF